jgi:hypothetical protein
MKTFLAAIGCGVALAATAASAQAASPEQRIAALEGQVATLTHALATRPTAPAQTPAQIAALVRRATALERRVTTLERQLRTARTSITEATQIAAAAIVFGGCSVAATSDAFASTWNVIDQISTATQAGKVYFGPQASVNDFQTCSALQITRQQGVVPPTVAVFSALTALLGEERFSY